MMKALVLAAALLAQTPGPASPAMAVGGQWQALAPQERAALLSTESRLPLAERLLRVSGRFLGTPYLFSPLGEGQGEDPDPPFRLDAVDCLTFVEQTLALSLASSEAELPSLLEGIRYASAPTYEDRNHLMEAQWLPNNLRKGFIADVTRRYAGEDSVRVEKVITERSWASRSSQALKLPRERQPQGSFSLDMIPLEKVLAHAPRVPSGTLLVVLREDLPLKVTRVTHLGFIIQKGRRTWLRHAARSLYSRVVDEELESFLARHSRYTKWRVTGVSLYEPRRPPMADSGVVVRSP
jgi:hypothetical protein